MTKLVTTIKKLEVEKLLLFLDENPSKKDVLSELSKKRNQVKKEISKLKEPVKNYSNFDRLLSSHKYKEYLSKNKEYLDKKHDLSIELGEIEEKENLVKGDANYDANRLKVVNLIPLIEESRTIEDIAFYTFNDSLEIKNDLKYILYVVLLLDSIDIIKKDEDIDKVYRELNIPILNKKLNDVNLETLIKNLKKIKIDIDDGFYQFITMIMGEKSFCNEKNLMASFPILKQLKKDKGVPKNIRVALDILDSKGNENRTIHEVGCEMFLKEIFYKIKEKNKK